MEVQVHISKGIIVKRIPDNEIILDFLYDLDVSPSSRATIDRSLKQFFKYLVSNKLNFNKLRRRDIIAYKEYLIKDNKSSSTIKSYLQSVKKFYQWCETNDYATDPTKGIKNPKAQKGYKKESLNRDNIKQLLSSIENIKTRDKIIITLALITGLRVIEIERLDCNDIKDVDGKSILMIHGKGRIKKDDFVVLPNNISKLLKEYTLNRFGAMFTSTSPNSIGKRLGKDSISKLIKKYFKKIHLDSKYYTAHSLRHTVAVLGLEAGLSIYEIQRALRHEDIRSTQIYTESGSNRFKLNNPTTSIIEQMCYN